MESVTYDKYDLKALDNECYPATTFTAVTTHEQRTALFRKWKQDDQGIRWPEFAKTIKATAGLDGAVVVKWCNMWLCIETDGYCHS